MTSHKWRFRLKNLFLPLFLIFGLGAQAQASLNAPMGQHDRVFAATEKTKKTVKKPKKKATKKTTKKPAKKKKVTKKVVKKPSKKKAHVTSTKKHKKTPSTGHAKKKAKSHSKSTTKKVYHKSNLPHSSDNDRVIGKRPDGREIFEGPRGGQYYYNDNDNRVYLKPDNKLETGTPSH